MVSAGGYRRSVTLALVIDSARAELILAISERVHLKRLSLIHNCILNYPHQRTELNELNL